MVPENHKERLVAAQETVRAKRARQADEQPPSAPEAAPPDVPLPLQARAVDTSGQPQAHTTCKRCAADVAADATECWNCGLRFPRS